MTIQRTQEQHRDINTQTAFKSPTCILLRVSLPAKVIVCTTAGIGKLWGVLSPGAHEGGALLAVEWDYFC
jgi:hypothetical protein